MVGANQETKSINIEAAARRQVAGELRAEFSLRVNATRNEIAVRQRLIGQEILDKFKQPFDLKGQEVFVTFSLGLYLSLDGNSITGNAITMADKAMYNAKKAGKNRYKLNISDLEKPV